MYTIEVGNLQHTSYRHTNTNNLIIVRIIFSHHLFSFLCDSFSIISFVTSSFFHSLSRLKRLSIFFFHVGAVTVSPCYVYHRLLKIYEFHFLFCFFGWPFLYIFKPTTFTNCEWSIEITWEDPLHALIIIYHYFINKKNFFCALVSSWN